MSSIKRLVAASLLTALLAALLASPAAAGPSPTSARAAPAESADLSSALADDGTFLGSEAFSGAVDTSAWKLTSDLAAGEAPRFEPAGGVAQGISAEWSALGSNGAGNGALNGNVHAVAFAGFKLYVGGAFTNAAGIAEADYVALWDGSSWSALGSNGPGIGALTFQVSALTVSGSDVYVGGGFSNAAGIAEADYLARWNGSAWSALGSSGAGLGALNANVHELVVAGSTLYAGGNFTNAAGIGEADYIARWSGSAWSALGSNGVGVGALTGAVYAIAIAGTDVFAGGNFVNTAGIAEADYVARWNGSAWSALGSNGSGNGALNSTVNAMAFTSALFVGGNFFNAAGVAEADYVARWNGSAWSALGSNGAGNGALNNGVQAIAAWGTIMYVGGTFTNAAGLPDADYVARWNGSTWSAIGPNGAAVGALNNFVIALAVSGSALYVGGFYTDAAGLARADYVAVAVGADPWMPLGGNSAGNGAMNYDVLAIAVSGSDVYVAGSFTNAAGIATADYVARWNGTAWSALGSNGAGNGALSSTAQALVVSGANVYVGGGFSNVAGIARADYVARWDGSSWSALGSNGAGNGALTDSVYTLAVSGADVYAGGFFLNAAGIPTADKVAKWNGSSWSALGSNGSGNGALNDTVFSIVLSGTNVYVGGQFLDAAGNPTADNIALWNGSAWSALGSNGAGNGALNNRVYAVAVSGANLYVGGAFLDAAGIPTADHIALWNGSAWSALGSNGAGNGALGDYVHDLSVAGSELYVAGNFRNAAGNTAADIVAKWTGSLWLPLGTNGAGDGALFGQLRAVAASGGRLYVGGSFLDAAGVPRADYVAAYGPIPNYQPDGRIRKGSGSYVGSNVYNADGTNQVKSGAKARGSTVTFGISIQNDGSQADIFRVLATGASSTMYSVRYFRGTTEITSAVNAGSYQTPVLAVGAKFLITAKVKVLSTATNGSSITRLVTINSVGRPGWLDAVKFTGKRS